MFDIKLIYSDEYLDLNQLKSIFCGDSVSKSTQKKQQLKCF